MSFLPNKVCCSAAGGKEKPFALEKSNTKMTEGNDCKHGFSATLTGKFSYCITSGGLLS